MTFISQNVIATIPNPERQGLIDFASSYQQKPGEYLWL